MSSVPSAPLSAPARVRAPRRPREVETAFVLYVVTLGLMLVVTSASLLLAPVVSDVVPVGSGDTEIGPWTIRAMLVGAFVLVAALLGGYALLVARMRAGSRAARTALTVLGALHVVVAAGFVREAAPTAVCSVTACLLVIVSIVLMRRPASNAYFAAR